MRASSAIVEAARRFDAQQFWEAHESLEAVWRAQSPPERAWTQGIIQVCAALVHCQRDHREPARTLFDAALAKLADAPREHLGLDVAALIAVTADWRAWSEGGHRPDAWPRWPHVNGH